ncbi:hypothetical protein SLEP1_g27777 [Rubroshorea leprosula]|uniref:Integrase catalytic domain-containing protein n=1 Tax=Rubroshorea leprosula TaxID=152421 RepID=A0AAV5K445_9ROSI|nr:hypothetical protein SLEP1_g27777 [Rubroshorea leprosula]
MFPPIDHAEGGDENQPPNSAHNSTSTANQDLLARNNLGDPLINLLNPAPQTPAPQQNPQPVQHAPALNESQGQSHIAPAQQPLPNDVTRRLDSLEKLVAEQRGAPPPHHTANSIPHPLNTNITLEPYLVGFKIPQLETYDGTKDPDDHLHAFYSCMQPQNASDALPPRSISSYTEMASAFVAKFSSIRLIKKTTSELMRVKQRDGDSLKNYMSRFNDAVLEVSSFDQAVRIAAVILGLNHERFRDSLLKHPATTFSEVNDRSFKFITAEEYALSQKPTPSKNQNPDWRDENQSRKRMRTAQNQGSMSTYTPRFGRPNSAPPQQSADHGHTTEQCNSLRSELESLTQKGMLNEYIQRAEQPRFVREQGTQSQGIRNPPNRQGVGHQQAPPPLPPPTRIIHMITGELEARGMSSKQRKLYVREACPKDCYPMPNINKLVEAAFGNERLSLLDAYSGYHQVPMALEDEEKTSFYAGDEIYCYVMMPYGLKNTGATYQKMVTIVFRAQIGQNLEVYINDIVVKSLTAEDHLIDLDETFNNLRKNRMRLNPAKCIFDVESRKFLCFMVSRRGIEVNPEKIKEVAKMEPPKSVKDILYVDGALSNKGSGTGAILLGLDGYRSEHALKYNFDATNNMAEYEALLLGLQLAIELKVAAIQIYNDSQLVVNQVNSVYEVVDLVMMNSRSIFVEILDEPSFLKPKMMEISIDPNTPSWRDPMISFLQDKTVPADKQEEMRLRKKASRYTLVNEILYKRSFSLPLLCCMKVSVEVTLIVADNGTQFNYSSFRDFCSNYGIKLQFTSVYHLESNGMVESANKVILEGIKPRLRLHKARWADELNNVLWAYKTTSQTATGETPYHLAFSTEAVIPIEIGVPSFKVTHFDEGQNGQLLRENLDLLDEFREEARLRTLVYKQKIANFYNKRVRP